MALDMPAMTVAAPIPSRRRYGLFDAAIGPLDLPAHGQGGGLRYIPDGCGSADILSVACYTPGAAPSKATLFDGDDPEIDTGVFVTMAGLLCNLVGYTQSELETKVRRRLELGEQAAVEKALWSGLDFEGEDTGIRSLDGEAVPIGGNYDEGLITDVVGALERYAYTTRGYGAQAFLHAPIEVAAFAAEAGLILQDGRQKVTPLGSVWAFGAYPPGEIIVTGQTTVWRSADADLVRASERTTNEALLLAERAYAVAFDCFAGRATYDPLEEVSP
jgi:hypothetical protein